MGLPGPAPMTGPQRRAGDVDVDEVPPRRTLYEWATRTAAAAASPPASDGHLTPTAAAWLGDLVAWLEAGC